MDNNYVAIALLVIGYGLFGVIKKKIWVVVWPSKPLEGTLAMLLGSVIIVLGIALLLIDNFSM
ncbi:MAG: hypothetical protein KA477_00895 [Candidatus Levybacteria bacterium]|nr:hypothetical protein [Candidatus Levybacteria bacterium]